MGTIEEINPAVRSILETARARTGGGNRVSIEARSLPAAFERAERAGRMPLLAEVKPTSPTTESERDADPVALANRMVEGGAAALSVLTEPEHFGGSLADLERVRSAVDVPVLRKDFVVRESQLDAVAADAVLLIDRFLDEPGTGDLAALVAAARDRGFQVLVETHSEAELNRALAAGADIVGVNNRDLARLSVDLGTFETVAPAVPPEVTLVAESGISSHRDVARMREAGADAVLVGSAIMDGDVRQNTRRLVTPDPAEPAASTTDEEQT
jgi:indole-3-glycerol phosphate synthase